MYTSLRSIGGWAPLPAALSMIGYALALDLWPLRAGQVFASLFRLHPFTLQPIHGWAAALPGIALWIVACYGAAAVGWVLWHRAGSVPAVVPALPHVRQSQGP
ncbi:MAG TPA: hypothetical protein VGC20_14220 [bacterium]